ncbi:Ig-like domain-containing protein [Siminovitchia sediminis]|uniref:Ig-like domain-containing protein n=1 Tax=Siminovitchia sediminis TaxID=1274353 RepID=A0ABW4KNV1_9BACI
MFVLDSQNKKVPIQIGLVNNKINVASDSAWKSGESYIIYLDNSIKLTSGKNVATPVKYSFSVR